MGGRHNLSEWETSSARPATLAVVPHLCEIRDTKLVVSVTAGTHPTWTLSKFQPDQELCRSSQTLAPIQPANIATSGLTSAHTTNKNTTPRKSPSPLSPGGTFNHNPNNPINGTNSTAAITRRTNSLLSSFTIIHSFGRRFKNQPLSRTHMLTDPIPVSELRAFDAQ